MVVISVPPLHGPSNRGLVLQRALDFKTFPPELLGGLPHSSHALFGPHWCGFVIETPARATGTDGQAVILQGEA